MTNTNCLWYTNNCTIVLFESNFVCNLTKRQQHLQSDSLRRTLTRIAHIESILNRHEYSGSMVKYRTNAGNNNKKNKCVLNLLAFASPFHTFTQRHSLRFFIYIYIYGYWNQVTPKIFHTYILKTFMCRTHQQNSREEWRKIFCDPEIDVVVWTQFFNLIHRTFPSIYIWKIIHSRKNPNRQHEECLQFLKQLGNCHPCNCCHEHLHVSPKQSANAQI